PRDRAWLRKAGIAALIVAAFAAAYYLGTRHKQKRYIAFAQCLSAKGAKMYGAFWCPHCAEQKEEFGSSFEQVTYVECGVPGSRTAQAPACVQAGVKHYPTWEFSDGTRVEGRQSFQYLGEKTGCSAP